MKRMERMITDGDEADSAIHNRRRGKASGTSVVGCRLKAEIEARYETALLLLCYRFCHYIHFSSSRTGFSQVQYHLLA